MTFVTIRVEDDEDDPYTDDWLRQHRGDLISLMVLGDRIRPVGRIVELRIGARTL